MQEYLRDDGRLPCVKKCSHRFLSCRLAFFITHLSANLDSLHNSFV